MIYGRLPPRESQLKRPLRSSSKRPRHLQPGSHSPTPSTPQTRWRFLSGFPTFILVPTTLFQQKKCSHHVPNLDYSLFFPQPHPHPFLSTTTANNCSPLNKQEVFHPSNQAREVVLWPSREQHKSSTAMKEGQARQPWQTRCHQTSAYH